MITYDGLEFRSKLEARWAATMDVIGWRGLWSYESVTLDGPYLPDFIVRFRPALLLVEVRPLLEQSRAEEQISASWEDEAIVVGDDNEVRRCSEKHETNTDLTTESRHWHDAIFLPHGDHWTVGERFKYATLINRPHPYVPCLVCGERLTEFRSVGELEARFRTLRHEIQNKFRWKP